MKEIPKEIMQKIEEKYPPTFETLGIRYDDSVFMAKRRAAEYGYQLADCEYWKKKYEYMEKRCEAAEKVINNEDQDGFNLNDYEQWIKLKSQEPR
jgi:glycyl-tRNA synthetase alpha subunit